jgi:hypothetical protein
MVAEPEEPMMIQHRRANSFCGAAKNFLGPLVQALAGQFGSQRSLAVNIRAGDITQFDEIVGHED